MHVVHTLISSHCLQYTILNWGELNQGLNKSVNKYCIFHSPHLKKLKSDWRILSNQNVCKKLRFNLIEVLTG